ncbi:MAG: 4Fe-4S cluster-binding domain-containing protein, partial [Negativicutes bacterium]|nr:4Fe-4S cluster-binding domain-containing protein [Negativicutes bacterium]
MTKETGESLAGAATAAGCGAEPAVHLFEREGIRVAVDRGSGAVHVVDRKVYELLLAGSTLEGCRRLAAERAAIATGRQRRRIVAAGRAIANLAAAGQLWGNGRELPADYRPPTVVKAMCLLVAHDCNLRCCYCFAGTGKFGGHRRLMSRETAERAVAFLFAASAGRRHVEIDFFGGEPMINLPVVRAAVAAVRRHEEKSGKRCRLTLTTNAFSVEEQDIVWLRDNQVALVLSCDGRPETHDRVRRDGNGRASHAR